MDDKNELIALTADIVSAHVSHNEVPAGELPALIREIHGALAGVGGPAPEPAREPAVPIKQSVKRDHIVCLEDGAKLKMLKRYLRTRFDMSPEEYRAKWGLPRDYPMVAPDYAEARRGLAHRIGLGRKSPEDAGEAAGVTAEVAETAGEAETKEAAAKPTRGARAKAAAKAHLGGDEEPSEA